MTPENPGAKGWSGLALLALVWGGAFAFIAIAVETIPPALVAFGRLTLAALVLTAWMVHRKRRFPPITDKRWVWFAALGLFGNTLPFTLIAIGQQTVPSGVAGILMGMTPLAIIMAAHFVLPNEKLNRFKAVGFIVGFSGIVLLMGPAALRGMLEADFLAQLIIFGATLCYATNAIAYQAAPQTPPSVVAAGSMICAAILAAPLGVYDLMFTDIQAPSLSSLMAVAALGLLPTALATIVYMAIARHVGAAFIALINYVVPVVAAVIGFMRGEPLTPITLAALGIILLGVFIARRQPQKA